MRSIICKALAGLFFLPAAILAKEPVTKTKESIPSYTVGKPIPNKTLKSGESGFIITITDRGTALRNAVVVLAYNGVEKKMQASVDGKLSIKVKPGKYKFQFYVQDFTEITTDSIKSKAGCYVPVEVNFMSAIYPVMVEKPVIYVYAPESTSVNIKLEPKSDFSFAYPAYKNGWSFTAGPDGTLAMGEKKYPYLFWEAPLPLENEVNVKEGYIVDKTNLIPFIEEKLKVMGFNAKESTDFITYWCPRMNEHEACYIHFLFNSDLEKHAPMQVEPKPDNIFRVCMVWSPVPANAEVTKLKEQKIPSLKRNGLTIVEWGGTEVNLMNP